MSEHDRKSLADAAEDALEMSQILSDWSRRKYKPRFGDVDKLRVIALALVARVSALAEPAAGRGVA